MTRIYGVGRYILWQFGTDDGYRYTNRRHAARAARESARTTSHAWVTDGNERNAAVVADYRRGERGDVYAATPGGAP